MGGSFSIGRLFDFQFRLHYSWFIIFLLVTGSLTWSYFPGSIPGRDFPVYLTAGILTSFLFFASVLAHEIAHSLVARRNDIPVKNITLFMFGGVANITREAARASVELRLAAAGPACSLVLGGLFALIWYLTGSISDVISGVALWLAQVNVILALFNLIPGFPLDGGRVFRSVLWRITGNYRRATWIATLVGRAIGYLFFLSGLLMMFWLQWWINGLWLMFIGWFVQNAASSSHREAKWRDKLRGYTASQLMTLDYLIVPSDATIVRLLREYVLTTGSRYFIVENSGSVEGILHLGNINSVPRQKWESVIIKDIMDKSVEHKSVNPSQDMLSVLEGMEEYGMEFVPVVVDGGVIGIITRNNVRKFFNIRSKIKV